MRGLRYIIYNLLNVLPAKGKSIAWRGAIIAKSLMHCGTNLKLSSRINIYNPQLLWVGDNVYIGYNSYIGGGKVSLADEVVIGPFCSIVAGNHTLRDGSYRFGSYDFGEIEIGRGTWLGSHVVITNNVKIGEGCVIGAGSVVTQDIPSNCFAAGIPAKVIKTNL